MSVKTLMCLKAKCLELYIGQYTFLYALYRAAEEVLYVLTLENFWL
jgi:hypothetical protein